MRSGRLSGSVALGALAAIAYACPASAQSNEAETAKAAADTESTEEDSAVRLIYTPEDFARFAPRTALDMLEEVPGFQIEEEPRGPGNETRGLGQASGNILINGERVSGKSSSASDQISRIPIANVIRIEIVDGATLDIPGLSGRVANVVAKAGGMSGQFEWRPRVTSGVAGFRWSQGDISISGSSGKIDYTIALENDANYRGGSGPNIIIPTSGSIDYRINTERSFFDQPKLSGNFGIDLGGNTSANVNLLYGRKTFRRTEEEKRTDPAAIDYLELIRTTNDGYEYEIGGDITFDLGAGRLKLIALDGYKTDDFVTRSRITIDDGEADTGRLFTRVAGEGERIGRAEYNWPLWGADWQLAVEGAFNRLDQVGTLSILDEGGEYQLTPFSSSTGLVTEDRYEAILSYSRPITDRLSMQLAAGMEYSRIDQSGANALSRSFKRPKGSLSLAWVPMDGLDVSLEVARRVGQLRFQDILGAVNLGNDNTNAGNNSLRPQQSWETELELTKHFGEWGTATLSLFNHQIEDYVTVVPIASGGESPGNVESARTRGLKLDATWQLAPLGFRGARVDIALQLEDSELEDPTTGVLRGFDDQAPRNFEIDFRHDVPGTDIAWGGSFRSTKDGPQYRVTQFGFQHRPSTFADAFVEFKDVGGLNVRVRWANLFRKPDVNYRTVYDGPRSDGQILFIEDRQRDPGYIFDFTIAGNF